MKHNNKLKYPVQAKTIIKDYEAFMGIKIEKESSLEKMLILIVESQNEAYEQGKKDTFQLLFNLKHRKRQPLKPLRSCHI